MRPLNAVRAMSEVWAITNARECQEEGEGNYRAERMRECRTDI